MTKEEEQASKLDKGKNKAVEPAAGKDAIDEITTDGKTATKDDDKKDEQKDGLDPSIILVPMSSHDCFYLI